MIILLLASLVLGSLCDTVSYRLATPLQPRDTILIEGTASPDDEFRISLTEGLPTDEPYITFFHLKSGHGTKVSCHISTADNTQPSRAHWTAQPIANDFYIPPKKDFTLILRNRQSTMSVYIKSNGKNIGFSCGKDLEKAKYLVFEKSVHVKDVKLFGGDYSLNFTYSFEKDGYLEPGNSLVVTMVYRVIVMPWELQLIDSQGNIPLHLHFDESKNLTIYAHVGDWKMLGSSTELLRAVNIIRVVYTEDDEDRKFTIYNDDIQIATVADIRKSGDMKIDGLQIIGNITRAVNIVDVHLDKEINETFKQI